MGDSRKAGTRFCIAWPQKPVMVPQRRYGAAAAAGQ